MCERITKAIEHLLRYPAATETETTCERSVIVPFPRQERMVAAACRRRIGCARGVSIDETGSRKMKHTTTLKKTRTLHLESNLISRNFESVEADKRHLEGHY